MKKARGRPKGSKNKPRIITNTTEFWNRRNVNVKAATLEWLKACQMNNCRNQSGEKTQFVIALRHGITPQSITKTIKALIAVDLLDNYCPNFLMLSQIRSEKVD